MTEIRLHVSILITTLLLLAGCSTGVYQTYGIDGLEYAESPVNDTYSYYSYPESEDRSDGRTDAFIDEPRKSGRGGWTQRVVRKNELAQLTAIDPTLSYSVAKQILARLNGKAAYYIAQDIRAGRPLKVPNDFALYKNWTPLPRYIPEMSNVAKFILIVKDIPFLGWYENGHLVGDSNVCIGKNEGWTKAGIYRVRDKDIDHVSGSYTNAYGVPAPMPWALRVYGHVWIHAGDITEGYCSHGCINLPLMPAQELYAWADCETAVMIVESLPAMRIVLDHNRSNCLLFAHMCRESDASRG